MKKFLKKINNVLKENEPLTDFISKIIFTIITIIIAINANKISNKQTQIDEVSLMPNLTIEKTMENESIETIELINNGGPVYNLQTESYSFLNVMYSLDNENIKIPIILHKKVETGNQIGLIGEYLEFIHTDLEKLENEISERLQKEGLEYKVILYTNTYFKISYNDKFNNSTTKYLGGKYVINEEMGKRIEDNYNSITPLYIYDIKLEEIVYNKIKEELNKT